MADRLYEDTDTRGFTMKVDRLDECTAALTVVDPDGNVVVLKQPVTVAWSGVFNLESRDIAIWCDLADEVIREYLGE